MDEAVAGYLAGMTLRLINSRIGYLTLSRTGIQESAFIKVTLLALPDQEKVSLLQGWANMPE